MQNKNSESTQDATEITVITSARKPKTYTLQTSAGNSAIITSRIMLLVVATLLICGEGLTSSIFFILKAFKDAKGNLKNAFGK